MATWSEYQEEAAEAFRALGLSAETNVRVRGVRSKHDLDVAVRGQLAGQDLFWVVECKRWKSRVSKAHVGTLIAVVADTGADRGILLSESGFQPGALALASTSNIHLTSLLELRVRTSDELAELRFADYRRRLIGVTARLNRLWEPVSRNRSRSRPGVDGHAAISCLGRAALAQAAIDSAELGNWPTPYGVEQCDGKETFRRAANRDQLLAGLHHEVTELEELLRAFEQAILNSRTI